MTTAGGGAKMEMTPKQCRAGRAWLGWSQLDLHRKSGVGLSTIQDLESENRDTRNYSRAMIAAAFRRAGVRFSPIGIYDATDPDIVAALDSMGLPE